MDHGQSGLALNSAAFLCTGVLHLLQLVQNVTVEGWSGATSGAALHGPPPCCRSALRSAGGVLGAPLSAPNLAWCLMMGRKGRWRRMRGPPAADTVLEAHAAPPAMHCRTQISFTMSSFTKPRDQGPAMTACKESNA